MTKTDTVIDHIDAPIREVIIGLNLLGFKTYMSCCGYNYKGQEEENIPKSHLEKAYVYLDYNQVMDSPTLCSLLTELCLESQWGFNVMGTQFIDFYGKTWAEVNPQNPWRKRESMHNYEIFLLAISALEKSIFKRKDRFLDRVIIEDGNEFYIRNVSKFWEAGRTPSAIVKYNSGNDTYTITKA